MYVLCGWMCAVVLYAARSLLLVRLAQAVVDRARASRLHCLRLLPAIVVVIGIVFLFSVFFALVGFQSLVESSESLTLACKTLSLLRHTVHHPS